MPDVKNAIRKHLIHALLFMKLLCAPVLALAKPITISWYGRHEAGKRMANGQRFDPRKLTAAHRHLPFGTRVRLFCESTRKAVVVTITDRGPFKARRSLDVSEAAAKQLGIRGAGLARADMEILPDGQGVPSRPYAK